MKLVASVLGAGILMAGVWFGSQALGGAAVACGSHCERMEPVKDAGVLACGGSSQCERVEQEESEVLACNGSSSCDLVEQAGNAELLACDGGSC